MSKISWFGVPIVQTPQSLQEYQQIIWEVKPNLIIETGIKNGGSLVFSASMLAALEACGEIENSRVIGIDIRDRHLNLPLGMKITMFIGSSVDEKIVAKVREITEYYDKILIFLDSNHTHNHVLAELKAYSPFVSVGSYIVVNDTGLEDLNYSKPIWKKRGWVKGSNPKTAVWQFLKNNDSFIIDKRFKVHPDGYLKKVK